MWSWAWQAETTTRTRRRGHARETQEQEMMTRDEALTEAFVTIGVGLLTLVGLVQVVSWVTRWCHRRVVAASTRNQTARAHGAWGQPNGAAEPNLTRDRDGFLSRDGRTARRDGLAVVCTPEEEETAARVLGVPRRAPPLPPPSVEARALRETLWERFRELEVPLGMLDKLIDLRSYHLSFVVDDSGSMGQATDSKRSDVKSKWMRARFEAEFRGAQTPSLWTILTGGVFQTTPGTALTRWEEAEDRLHLFLELLALVDFRSIRLSFLNLDDVVEVA